MPFVKFRPFWRGLARPGGSTHPRPESACGLALADGPPTRCAQIKMSISQIPKRIHGAARLHQIFPTTPALHGCVAEKLARSATFDPAPTFSGDRVCRKWSIFCCLHKRGSAAKSAIREVPPVLARPGATPGMHIPSPGIPLRDGSCGRAPNSFRSAKNI